MCSTSQHPLSSENTPLLIRYNPRIHKIRVVYVYFSKYKHSNYDLTDVRAVCCRSSEMIKFGYETAHFLYGAKKSYLTLVKITDAVKWW